MNSLSNKKNKKIKTSKNKTPKNQHPVFPSPEALKTSLPF